MKDVISNNGCVVRKFDSVSDIVDHGQMFLRQYFESEFIGRDIASSEDLIDKINGYWSEGVSIINGMISEIDEEPIQRPLSRRRSGAWSDSDGDDIDYDRLSSGGKFWRSTKRTIRRGSITELVTVDIGTIGAVSYENILWRGAAAIVIAKILESTGRRCEIIAVNRVEGVFLPGEPLLVSIPLKRSADPININELVIAMSSWFYRTVVLRSRLTNPTLPHICPISDGGSRPLSKEDISELSGYSSIHIEKLWSRSAAILFIKSKLGEFAHA